MLEWLFGKKKEEPKKEEKKEKPKKSKQEQESEDVTHYSYIELDVLILGSVSK